jgi:hypothetical protein
MGKDDAPSRARRIPARRGFTAFMRTLAMLALALQVTVIQTHVEAPARLGEASFSLVQAATVSTPAPGQAQDRLAGACFICQSAAAARVGLVTPTMALVRADAAGLRVAPVTVAQHAPRAVSHAWRSRAPPVQL